MTNDAALLDAPPARHRDRAPRASRAPRGWRALQEFLPRGNTLTDADWQRRHRLLQWVLVVHVPVLAVIAAVLRVPAVPVAVALTIPVICAVG
ncbi:MAG TPA: hypothetical protein VF667_08515, partial [Pseudonocardia sp.]